MIVIPAIDIRGGKCVRLFQGREDRETVYGGDPAAIPALLAAGLRDLSVVPAQLAMAKATIASVTV